MKRWMMIMMLMAWVPATANAEPCETDQDCPEGMLCAMSTMACPPCEPGKECPPCETETQGECMEAGGGGGEFWGGTECETDADCPSMFHCEEVEMGGCGGSSASCACPDCAPGEECPPCVCDEISEDPEDCETTTAKVCVYKQQECAADADCAEGFECQEEEVCWGSGGGVACTCAGCVCPTCEEGEECPPCDCPAPDECECDDEPVETTEECEVTGSYCVPVEVPCQSDADCAADWECVMLPVACACPGCACEEGSDCSCPPCECDEESTDGICAPAGWGQFVTSENMDGGSGGAQENGTSSPLDDLFGEGSAATGVPKATDNDSGGGNGNNATGGDGTDQLGNSNTDDGSSGGCSAIPGATSGLALSLLLSLAILQVRRRPVRS